MRGRATPVSLLQTFLCCIAFTVTVIFWSYHGHILTLKPCKLVLILMFYCRVMVIFQSNEPMMVAGLHCHKSERNGWLAKLVLPCDEDVWTLSEGRRGESFCLKNYLLVMMTRKNWLGGKAARSRGKLFLRGSTHLQWTTPPCTRYTFCTPPCTRYTFCTPPCTHSAMNHPSLYTYCNEPPSLYTFSNEPPLIVHITGFAPLLVHVLHTLAHILQWATPVYMFCNAMPQYLAMNHPAM